QGRLRVDGHLRMGRQRLHQRLPGADDRAAGEAGGQGGERPGVVGGIFPALAKDDRAVRPCLHRRASDAVSPGIPAAREKVVRIRPMKYVAAAALAAATVLLLAHAGWADSKEGPRRWTRVVKKQSEVVYKVVFVAEAKDPNKKYAEFAVIGDG